MLIGEDYPKIKIQLGNYLVYEPNVFITDVLMSIACFLFAYHIYKSITYKSEFMKWWSLFFLIFGFSSLAGALGHAFFHYWGPEGKVICWLTSVIAVYAIERAMISKLIEVKFYNFFVLLSKIKMAYFMGYLLLICFYFSSNYIDTKGFTPIAINTIGSVFLSAGFVGWYLSKRLNSHYKWFIYGVCMMVPAAFIFLMKISFFRWFDKNDLSHLFITLGFFLFYKAIKLIESENKEPIFNDVLSVE